MVSRVNGWEGAGFERVVLETSLKPFRSFVDADIRETALEIAKQWMPLLDSAHSAAVLLWIADGSELLDWAGRDGDEVEWARWVGFNNTAADPYGHNVTPDRWAKPYREDAPALDYASIRRVVAGVRAAVHELSGLPVEIGATMDSGPEFAQSNFKYERHQEMLADGASSGVGRVIRMVRPWNLLNSDDRVYAEYPNGIPADTPFGEFLGRQSRSYLTAMGFDYLWLSNGFGFSSYSWTAFGELFDGNRFASERADEVRGRILDFWTRFNAEVGFPVEVRGTNFGIGMDLATDGVPARDIYANGVVRMPPPNSPWGPLNRDIGIELTGYLSRIARLPGEGFPFRFYVNDPWFWQTPWRDFYHGEPFDIHLPLSLSRIGSTGAVELASQLEILSVDTERGELNAADAAEVAMFIARSRTAAPDAPPPLVWLYPFDAYHDVLEQQPRQLDQLFFEDWLLSAAVNHGLPIGAVVDVVDAPGAIRTGALDESVLITPASGLDDSGLNAVLEALQRGIDVVVYGSLVTRPDAAASLFGLNHSGGEVSGDLELSGGLGEGTVRHAPVLSGGPITELLDASSESTVLAMLGDRPYAVERHIGEATVRWLRGSSDFDSAPEDEHGLRSPRAVDRAQFTSGAALLGTLVARTDWQVRSQLATSQSAPPVVTFSRHQGSLRVSGYFADTTSRVGLRTPNGAPILIGRSARVRSDEAVYQFSTTMHEEARVYVSQSEETTVECTELAPFPFGAERLIGVRGLLDATVVLALPPGRSAGSWVLVNGERVEPELIADRLQLEAITGELSFGWHR